MSDWTDELKVGDSVGVRSYGARGGSAPIALATVEKLTKTQVTVLGKRYSRNSGRIIGGSRWDSARIVSLQEAQEWNQALAKAEAEERAGHRAAIAQFLADIDAISLRRVSDVARNCVEYHDAARVARNNALNALHTEVDK